jgi:hypothetical protein
VSFSVALVETTGVELPASWAHALPGLLANMSAIISISAPATTIRFIVLMIIIVILLKFVLSA